MFLRTSILLFSLALPVFIFAQTILPVGTPAVQQYSKSQYKAGNQNWSISVDKTGMIYTGNNEGLLSFDGQYWSLHLLPNKSIVRSVKVSNDGKIYTGGHGEFGYWERFPLGKMKYTSLSKLVKNQQQLKNDEIWRIAIHDKAIYFQAFSKTYIYENHSIKELTAAGEPFLFLHHVKNKLFLEQIPSGLHLLENNELSPLAEKDILKYKNILTILPFDNNNYIIGTANNGLYKLDNQQQISFWACEASTVLADRKSVV